PTLTMFFCSLSSLSSSTVPLPTGTALFPYTTLFRSRWAHTGSVGSTGCGPVEHGRASCWADAVGWTQQAGAAQQIAQSCWVDPRSEEHTSELQSRGHLVCRHRLEKKIQTDAVSALRR